MKKHGGHHGGAWKVAYADFVTAMMALFLVLWLTAQDAKIKEAIERAFRNPFSSVTAQSVGIIANDKLTSTVKASGQFKSETAVEIETMRRINDDLAKILKQPDPIDESIKIDLTPEGLRINVYDRSHKPIFEPQSDVFTEYGGWVFQTLAWEISRYKMFKLELEGHTEAGPESPAPAHPKWELSTERANAARRRLVENGVTGGQICKVSGYADTVPMPDVAPTNEANRRVTVLLKLKDTLNQVTASATNTVARDDHGK